MGTCEVLAFRSTAANAVRTTKQRLERELADLRELLLPFYEDEEEKLDADIEREKSRVSGIAGLMAAIGWCSGELAIYRTLNEANPEDGE